MLAVPKEKKKALLDPKNRHLQHSKPSLGMPTWQITVVAQRCVGSPVFEWCYEQGCWSDPKLLCDGSNIMSSRFQLCTISKLHDEFNTRLFHYTVNHCFLNSDFPFFTFYQLVPIFFTYFLPPGRGSVEIFLYNDWHLITFLQLIISLFEGNEAKKRANEMPLGRKEA